MRVLHVISAFQLGGAEEIAIGLSEGLAVRGHECFVVAVGRTKFGNAIGARQKDRLSRAQIPFTELGGQNTRTNLIYTPVKLLNLLREWEPDIVHSHTDIPDLTVSLAFRLRRYWAARTIQNTILWPTHRLMGLISESGFNDELVFSVSADAQSAYEALRNKYKLPISNHRLIINNSVAVRGQGQRPGKRKLLEDFGADDGKVQFCFAGRFDYQKGFDILIDALGGLPRTYLDQFELQAFGTGKEMESYARKISDSGLPIQVHAPEPQISRLFPAFDAMLMPSRFEGLALVALESLAAGVPVIGTSARGLRESVPPNWPLLAPAEDPDAYRTLLIRFLDGEFDRDDLVELGRSWVSKNHDVSQMIDQYEQAYHSYLNSVGNPKRPRPSDA